MSGLFSLLFSQIFFHCSFCCSVRGNSVSRGRIFFSKEDKGRVFLVEMLSDAMMGLFLYSGVLGGRWAWLLLTPLLSGKEE
ncbi:MAG: hypothetical protein HUU50_05005 [Candidatus Brocadiae bacterium]|nr:hypothetical protein [Candidatus Brocadiia bacterium]